MGKMTIGKQLFDCDRHTYVMGILNVTPDSFSDGGQYTEEIAVLSRVEEMIEEGVDIIDVGGESTRPGYLFIEEAEEIRRVVPFIRAIKRRFSIPVSIDTYKVRVAEAAVEVGCDLINDIWGLQYDRGEMAELIADCHLPCCLMHNRKNPEYKDFYKDVVSDLRHTLSIADKAGIASDQIILDPGIGFAKTPEQNLHLINNLDKLSALGYPVLLGASRKSVIGHVLNLPVNEREEGTLVTTVMAVMKGASFVRVHDVKKNKRAIMMAEEILAN